MPLFTSRREKHLWLWVLAVLLAIFSTLFVGQPLAELFRNQDVQAVIFLLGMLLVGLTILVHALRKKVHQIELALWLGITAVYAMLFLRLGLAERSHLIEYSVLAIFIHRALIERRSQGKLIAWPALLALVSAFIIGVLDEGIQFFLPNRVFDPVDIFFNGMAATLAIGFTVGLDWVRKRLNRDK